MSNKTIKEDIKILKEIYTDLHIDSNNLTIIKVRKQAIENVLENRRELEEESNKYKNLLKNIRYTIEKLNKRKLNLEKNLNEENLGDNILVVEELKGIKKQIEILQKLIESED